MSSVTRINAANGVALLEDSLEPILGGNLATLRVPNSNLGVLSQDAWRTAWVNEKSNNDRQRVGHEVR